MLAGYLVYRGISGRSRLFPPPGRSGSEVGDTVSACSQITIQRSPQEVYAFLRKLENLPKFSRLLSEVEATIPGQWRCRVRTPWGAQLEWEMEASIVEEGKRLAWRATPSSTLPCAAEIRLSSGGYGTAVFVDTWAVPPAARVSAPLLRRAEQSRPLRRAGLTPSKLLEHDLRRLRQLLEAGETVTVSGQPTGRVK